MTAFAPASIVERKESNSSLFDGIASEDPPLLQRCKGLRREECEKGVTR
jgi:hypothetical protein